LKKGDSLRFANYLGHEPVMMRELAPGAYLAMAGGSDGPVRLALTGPCRAAGVEFDGESCFAGPRGLIAAKVKSLKAGGLDLKFEQPQDVKLEASRLPPGFFAALRAAGEKAALKTPLAPEVKTVELKVDKIDFGSRVTALAAFPDGTFAAGTEKGLFRVLGADGKTRFECRPGAEITAVAGFAVNGVMRYFAAVAPEKIDGDAKLLAFDPAGKELWSEKFGLFQSRNGTIRTMFPAKLDKDGSPSLIAGNEGWHYFAYTPDGKLKWKRQIYHGATAGAAADLDGDGFDEIIAGAEYYYHQLLGRDGKVIFQKNTDPWNYAVAAVDLDGDGKKEALCGRSDGRIHVMTPPGGSKLEFDAIPAGGITAGIVPFAGNGGKFAAATADGRVVFCNGAGKVVKSLELPADLAGIAVRGDEIIAAGLDGRAYLVKADGSWRAVKLGASAPLRLPPPAPAAAGATAAVAAGDVLYLIH
ncbi:MAG: FG-GAP repeat domain-containing protein, partial [Victivallaceae bacterium]